MHSLSNHIIKSFFGFIKEILYFPIWWYTQGSFNLVGFLFDFIKSVEKYFALWVWIKNIFKPMYSQYDFAGVIISFFVRVFQIIVRSIVMFILIFLCVGIFLIWLTTPIVVGSGIFFQLF